MLYRKNGNNNKKNHLSYYVIAKVELTFFVLIEIYTYVVQLLYKNKSIVFQMFLTDRRFKKCFYCIQVQKKVTFRNQERLLSVHLYVDCRCILYMAFVFGLFCEFYFRYYVIAKKSPFYLTIYGLGIIIFMPLYV